MKIPNISPYKWPGKACSWILQVSVIASNTQYQHQNITGLTEVAHYVKDCFSHYTIRSSSCSILVPGSDMRCAGCADYRLVLNVMLHRHKKTAEKITDGADPKSHKNYRFQYFYVCN